MWTDGEIGAWLVAERDHQLAEARTALLDGEQTIYSLREQVIDRELTDRLDEAGIDRRDVADLLDVVDRAAFLRTDGAVDTERLSAFVETLRKAEPKPPVERRPPPRTSDRYADSNRGQGRYLEATS